MTEKEYDLSSADQLLLFYCVKIFLILKKRKAAQARRGEREENRIGFTE